MEHRRALARRIALREALERVPHHIVRERDLVHREVTLEHAARRRELLDAVREERRQRRRELLGADWLLAGMPVEAAAHHANAAALHYDVRTRTHRSDALAPVRQPFIV